METPPRDAAEEIRRRCIDAARSGYEDALMSGLCREGAWEAAVSAIQRLDLERVSDDASAAGTPTDDASSNRELAEHCIDLARRFTRAGPPAAGSAAAVTGAIAAGLLEWAAGATEGRGQEAFRSRAGRIRGRAAALAASLASAAQEDASVVGSLVESRDRADPRSVLLDATESVLEVATGCSQVATLVAELTPHAQRTFRPDLEVALRLACSASQSALDLFETNRPGDEEGSEWLLSAKRRAWRVRLLLRRAAVGIRSSDWE